ncbi:MBL fold metallo-hydrolase [Streptomyces sp. NPDC018610]|uniref:MBL fold metallo-hydrolase n=1 Tax=Streptomyces sp. NPDC018610 TaxID=3365049 RepID=UPI0037A952B0
MTLRAVGGPTAVLELGGLRLLTDPTFDQAGSYTSPSGSVLTKTAGPAFGPEELGPVDAVLLSHDQHADNLDRSGRAFLPTVPVVFSTPDAAARLGGGTRALAPWAHAELARPDGAPALRITGVPARHGPVGCEPVCGEVTGFVLTAPDLPTVYVSGDNASLAAVRQVADRFGPVDVAVIFAGGARTKAMDGALLTLDSVRTAEAARILGARRCLPLHCDSWEHFTEGRDDLRAAFAAAGLADRLTLLPPGRSAAL